MRRSIETTSPVSQQLATFLVPVALGPQACHVCGPTVIAFTAAPGHRCLAMFRADFDAFIIEHVPVSVMAFPGRRLRSGVRAT